MDILKLFRIIEGKWRTMLGYFFKKLFVARKAKYIKVRVTENRGAIIPWHKGVILKPLTPVSLAIPEQIFGKGELIGDVLHCSDKAEINSNLEEHLIYLGLKPGMQVWLTKSCEAIVYTDNRQPVTFEMEIPPEYQKYIPTKYKNKTY